MSCAVRGGNEEIVNIVSQSHPFHNTARTAIQYHRNNILPWIIDNYNNSGLFSGVCLEFFNTEAFFFLTSKGLFETDPEVLLRTAVQNEVYDLVRYFVDDQKVSVNLENPEQQQAQNGQLRCPFLITAILQHSPKIVSYLLERGADVETMWVNHTPLLIAAQYRNSDVVAALIKKGDTPSESTSASVAFSGMRFALRMRRTLRLPVKKISTHTALTAWLRMVAMAAPSTPMLNP